MATLTSCYFQEIEKLRLASPLSDQVYDAKLFKVVSYTQVLLAVFCEPFIGFATSNLWHLLKSKRSEYFIVYAYIIPSFAFISYFLKFRTQLSFVQLYIELS